MGRSSDPDSPSRPESLVADHPGDTTTGVDTENEQSPTGPNGKQPDRLVDDAEDGPLDPSAFDGLFDDLVAPPTERADEVVQDSDSEPAPTEPNGAATDSDNPLQAFLETPLIDDGSTVRIGRGGITTSLVELDDGEPFDFAELDDPAELLDSTVADDPHRPVDPAGLDPADGDAPLDPAADVDDPDEDRSDPGPRSALNGRIVVVDDPAPADDLEDELVLDDELDADDDLDLDFGLEPDDELIPGQEVDLDPSDDPDLDDHLELEPGDDPDVDDDFELEPSDDRDLDEHHELELDVDHGQRSFAPSAPPGPDDGPEHQPDPSAIYASPAIRETPEEADARRTGAPDHHVAARADDFGPDRDDPDRPLPTLEPESLPAIEAPSRSRSRRGRWLLPLLLLLVIAGITGGVLAARQLSSTGQEASDQTDSVDADAPAPTGQSTETEPTTGDATEPVSTEPAVDQPDQTSTEPAPTSPVLSEAPDRLQVTSLRFAAGTTELTDDSAPTLELVAEAIGRQSDLPLVATVRTYTEATPSEDLSLSIRQAEALVDRLVELGADPGQVSAIGLGRSLLSPAQPVPTFVVASAGLTPSPLRDVIDQIGPFAIGLDRETGELRRESVLALERLGQTMAADPDGRTLTLASYAFDQSDTETNRAQAAAAVDAVVGYLVQQAGIDADRLETIVLGDAPYAVPDRVANHIDLRWGEDAVDGPAIAALSAPEGDFATGLADLTETAGAAADQLAAAVADPRSVVVIEVHSYDGADDNSNVELSVARARAVGQRLTQSGLSAEQLRLHARGASPQFESEGRTSRLVVTVVPTRRTN